MKQEPRFYCADGVSLSIQASKYHYASPRNDSRPSWTQYDCVEVGFIKDANNQPVAPPEEWRQYSDGEFPSDVYGYVPVALVHKFIADHSTTMTADNITVERLEDLLALLDSAWDSVFNVQGKIEQGDIDPAEAAAIVNETIQNLTNEAR